MKRLIKIFIVIIVLLVIIFLARNLIAQSILSYSVKALTGLSLKTGSIDLGIPEPHILAQNLKLLNPEGFRDTTMLDIPEIYIDYDLEALFAKVVHLRELRLNMKEFIVVKNPLGELNLNFLKVVKSKSKPAQEQEEERTKLPQIKIDLLKLSIGKVIFKDYSVNIIEPSIREFNININEQFENITDPYALASLIIVKALANTSIASLANFNLKGLESDLENIAQGVAASVTDSAEKIGNEVQKTAEDVTKSLEETGKGLKETFSLPFGKQ